MNGVSGEWKFLFVQDGGHVRLPVWGHVPLSLGARKVIEHPDFVRLQRVNQLLFVEYAFPGATHTRFEHCIGTYHLARLMVRSLLANPDNALTAADSPGLTPLEARVFLAAALLHDIGHYPCAHLMDHLPFRGGNGRFLFQSHEERAREYLDPHRRGGLAQVLRDYWEIPDPALVADAIAPPENAAAEDNLPARLLSGIVDPDKMDYLMRDAAGCGVPYGHIDSERLIESLVLDNGPSGRRLAITEKGIAPLESLIFCKYMMFRHIYWHHTARIASAMFGRFVQDAVDANVIEPAWFYELSDDALQQRLCAPEVVGAFPAGELMPALVARRLYKRAVTLYPEPGVGEAEFRLGPEQIADLAKLYRDPERRRAAEQLACAILARREGISLAGHEVLLDIPEPDSVFDVEDFETLRVLVSSQRNREHRFFVPFNDYGFSQMKSSFAQEFERYSRKVRVVCRADLRGAVLSAWNELWTAIRAAAETPPHVGPCLRIGQPPGKSAP
ncbi:MAG: HD domain-containing protein [Armatimonadota bacterium]|nr:HD domain-containing protein [Armatimonadota bacterium]